MTQSGSIGTRDRARARRWFATAGLSVLMVAMAMAVLAMARGFGWPFGGPKPHRLGDVLSKTIETGGIDAAVAEYRTRRERGFAGLHESEANTNHLGYALLRQGDTASATEVFQLNAETHPRSANAYDSLAEAHLAAGNEPLAIEDYQRAVALDPRMKSAVAALHRLTNRKRPPYPPLVLFHISAGMVGLLSGAVAASLRKGSRRHGVAGNVFVVSMLGMSATGAYMAFVAPHRETINVLMGTLTFYLVATAWRTARRRNGGTDVFDGGALLVALAVATGLANLGLDALRDGASPALYIVFGSVALLASLLDVRMIVGGGVFGAARIARHLWRMCAALFIAVASLFLGQPQVFPDALRASGLLAVPPLLVLILLVFWLIRVSFTRAFKSTASPPAELPRPLEPVTTNAALSLPRLTTR